MDNSQNVLNRTRGLLAILGIVLHSATIFRPDSQLPMASLESHWIFGSIVQLIHSFRMEAFFLVAGIAIFFAHRKLSSKNILVSRAMRLGVPLLTTLILLNIPTVMLLNAIGVDLDNTIGQKGRSAHDSLNFVNTAVHHLWFLIDLIVFSTAYIVVAGLYKHSGESTKQIATKLKDILEAVPVPIWFILIPAALCGPMAMAKLFPALRVPLPIVGSPLGLLYFGGYFALGATLASQTNRLEIIMKWRPNILLTAACLSAMSFYGIDKLSSSSSLGPNAIVQLAHNTIALALTYITIQLIQTLNQKARKKLDSLGEASYTIFLVHHPIIWILAGLMQHSNLPIFVQFSILLFVTYETSLMLHRKVVAVTRPGRLLLNGISEPSKVSRSSLGKSFSANKTKSID
jgi:glucans biosynthesis protein C